MYYKGQSSCTRTAIEYVGSALVAILFAYVIIEANGVDALWAFKQTLSMLFAALH